MIAKKFTQGWCERKKKCVPIIIVMLHIKKVTVRIQMLSVDTPELKTKPDG